MYQKNNSIRKWADTYQEKTYAWPINTWNDAQHPSLLEKYTQNYNEVPPHTSQTGHHQKICKQYMLERMWGKRNPLALLVRI